MTVMKDPLNLAGADAGGDADRPQRHAAALSYASRERRPGGAPRVVAKGHALVADEIVRRARLAGVPVHASRELVSLLMQVDLDQHVPPALYVAVAEVLAWAWRLEQDAAAR